MTAAPLNTQVSRYPVKSRVQPKMVSKSIIKVVNGKSFLFHIVRSPIHNTQRCCFYSRIKEDLEDEEFKVLNIYRDKEKEAEFVREEIIRGHMTRADCMRTDQSWTDVWPTKAPFHWGSVPIPVRQGFRKKKKLLALGRYGNIELMKIPNFLHLTPPHIKKHCQAIKKFCTKFPEELKNLEVRKVNFPIEVITSDYVTCGTSIRDSRAREVKVNVNLSVLKFDDHASMKMKKLAGEKLNEETKTLQLTSDRCPLRKQNYDFNIYKLTALYYESHVTEPWEDEMEESDWVVYQWDKTQSRNKILHLKSKIQQIDSGQEEKMEDPDVSVVETETDVQQYKAAFCDLKDKGDNEETLNAYKQSVLKLLNL
ncbi:28S ribosomal protein S35, mitochondrial-like isoform X2 [Ostrea edulis]|uniref:28S ribosomal protein S35, mitochondrial-like isoform X2 n=1 Tax=Ostrea edulis TaxID=37623 RepID=UPI0024AF4D57|nr:28S ribosomal protein S35, mitochondrial-like isoform X2 [Ostrea edulis]